MVIIICVVTSCTAALCALCLSIFSHIVWLHVQVRSWCQKKVHPEGILNYCNGVLSLENLHNYPLLYLLLISRIYM